MTGQVHNRKKGASRRSLSAARGSFFRLPPERAKKIFPGKPLQTGKSYLQVP